MIRPCLAIVALMSRRAAPAAFIVGCLWATLAQSLPAGGAEEDLEGVPDSVEVFGKVVDAETGQPVTGFITQAGMFDPKDPKKVTWGFSETRTGESSSYSATIRWKKGWTARILADGYVPQPVIEKAPPAGKNRIEILIRLKKGRTVRGRVLDHLGKPVEGASVFAIRSIQLTLAGGKAVHSYDGEEDKTVRGVKTDAKGRFEISVGDPPAPTAAPAADGAKDNQPASDEKGTPPAGRRSGLVVSSPAIDAWPAPLPEGNDEAVIRLPAPTKVEFEYDIEGSDGETTIFLQSLMHEVEEWKGFEIMRRLTIQNQKRAKLASLPPGRYQFARSRQLRHGNIGQGLFLDRQYVDVASDKTTTVSFVRKAGARIKGSVEWEEGTKLTGIVVTVRKIPPADASRGDQAFPTTLDARLLRVTSIKDPGDKEPDNESTIEGNRGVFLTERIPPGTYEVRADGYAPLTREQMVRLGPTGPALTARTTVTVPESGAVPPVKLEFKKPEGKGGE